MGEHGINECWVSEKTLKSINTIDVGSTPTDMSEMTPWCKLTKRVDH